MRRATLLSKKEMTSGIRDKPYILVAISGGVAEVVRGRTVANVEVLDFDNLDRIETPFDRASLSKRAQTFLRNTDPALYDALYKTNPKEK